jgi:hypothetical protein
MIATVIAVIAANTQPMVVAAPVSPAPAAPASVIAARSEPTKAAEPRYCIIDTPPNSRIARKYCNSRAGWAVRGVDIP